MATADGLGAYKNVHIIIHSVYVYVKSPSCYIYKPIFHSRANRHRFYYILLIAGFLYHHSTFY